MKFPGSRLSKHLAQASATQLWRAGFAALRWARPATATPWSSRGDERVLVVAPHPDDETAGCAGTLLRHREAGDSVTVVCLTDGRRSTALGLKPDAMAATRRREVAEVAKRLDFELSWEGLKEGEWSLDTGVRALAAALARAEPTRIYAPTCLDFHPEHRQTAHALAGALAEWTNQGCGEGFERHQPTIHGYPISVPFQASMVDQIVPVARYEAQILAAFDAYASQRGALQPALRLRRYLASRFHVPGLAEGFWTRSSSSYQQLHTELGDGGGARGMRYLSWTDPLAYRSAPRLRRTLAQPEPVADRCRS